MTPRHHEDGEEIPHELCRKSFLTMENAIKVFWILLVSSMAVMATAIAWGYNTSHDMTVLQENSKSSEQVNKAIFEKLDILLKKSEEKHGYIDSTHSGK